MTLRTADTAVAARIRIRTGEHAGPTSGLAPGFAQANLVVLPAEHALDFVRFCVRNPKPCPLLEVTDTGSPYPAGTRSRCRPAHRCAALPGVPRRRSSSTSRRSRRATGGRTSSSFLLGCSFTFEWALASAGLPLAHQTAGRQRPDVHHESPLRGRGTFSGPLVVSMRPFAPSGYPPRRGGFRSLPAHARRPVHIGDPAAIGIRDIHKPDSGDCVRSEPGEVPVFWACGVTPQAVAIEARPSLAIFHTPGHMFVTDRAPRRIRLSGGGP